VEAPFESTDGSLWSDVAARLRGALNESTFTTWFGEVRASEVFAVGFAKLAAGVLIVAALAFMLLPANVWAVLITTDTPLILFSVASMLAFARERFLLAGVLLGLAFLSKYFAVLLGLAYLVWAVAARRPAAFGLAFLGALPFGLVNLYWNWQACWCNVMFNAINRHEGAGLSWSTPALGPVGVPPPHEYGTPICEAPRRITYSIACGPRTRPTPTLPVLAPPLLPPRPMLCRNF